MLTQKPLVHLSNIILLKQFNYHLQFSATAGEFKNNIIIRMRIDI
jgi:hypothetical protein